MIWWTFLQDHRLPLAVVPLVLCWVPRACTSRTEPSFASEDGLSPGISGMCYAVAHLSSSGPLLPAVGGQKSVTVCLLRANVHMFSVCLTGQMCYCGQSVLRPCWEVDAIIPMLQMRKPRHRDEVTCPDHSPLSDGVRMFLQSDSRCKKLA